MSMMASGAAGGEEGSGPNPVAGYKRLNKVPSYAKLDTLYYRASSKAIMEWKVNGEQLAEAIDALDKETEKRMSELRRTTFVFLPAEEQVIN